MIKRVELFHFKSGAEKKALKRLVKMPEKWLGFNTYVQSIKYLKDVWNESEHSYQWGMELTFDSLDDIDIYERHELHLQFCDELRTLSDDTLVRVYSI